MGSQNNVLYESNQHAHVFVLKQNEALLFNDFLKEKHALRHFLYSNQYMNSILLLALNLRVEIQIVNGFQYKMNVLAPLQ